jgi:hypothetical protein
MSHVDGNQIRYVFFYPSTNIGGAQLLFARIAERLIKDDIEILIIEHEKSFITKYLSDRDLIFSICKTNNQVMI